MVEAEVLLVQCFVVLAGAAWDGCILVALKALKAAELALRR